MVILFIKKEIIGMDSQTFIYHMKWKKLLRLEKCEPIQKHHCQNINTSMDLKMEIFVLINEKLNHLIIVKYQFS